MTGLASTMKVMGAGVILAVVVVVAAAEQRRAMVGGHPLSSTVGAALRESKVYAFKIGGGGSTVMTEQPAMSRTRAVKYDEYKLQRRLDGGGNSSKWLKALMGMKKRTERQRFLLPATLLAKLSAEKAAR